MKKNKGGNKNKEREDAKAGETILRSIQETLDNSINSVSSVARGKNRVSANNNNAKGGALL
jgi:hypothetical protein